MSRSVKTKLAAPGYASLVRRIRSAVEGALPEGARVLVVGKGDREMAKLGNRTTAQFPQDESGEYAGHHPSDADAAIAQLESLRAAGAQYILFPSTAYWWIEHYGRLFRHLEERGREVSVPADVCRIWELSKSPSGETSATMRTVLPAAAGQGSTPEPPRQPLDGRVPALLRALLEPGATIAHLREPGHPELGSSEFTVRSIEAPTARDREDGDPLASIRSLGADVLLILGARPDLGWLDEGSASIRDLLERSLPRIAHREHLCTLYDLNGGATSMVAASNPSDGHSHAEA